jgi:hypothetical protein
MAAVQPIAVERPVWRLLGLAAGSRSSGYAVACALALVAVAELPANQRQARGRTASTPKFDAKGRAAL